MGQAAVVAKPTYPLRETGIALAAVGVILLIVAVISESDCGLLGLFCAVGLLGGAIVISPILIVVGYAVTRYHRPPEPSQVAGQPSAQVCPTCGEINRRLSSGFCFNCGSPLPPTY